MVKYSFLFLVIAVIATILYLTGYRIALVIPGWHVELDRSFVLVAIFCILWLYLLSLGYFVFEKKNLPPSKWMVMIHLVLTLPFFYYFNGAYSLYDTHNGYWNLMVPLWLFALGQLLFVVMFIKLLTTPPRTPSADSNIQ